MVPRKSGVLENFSPISESRQRFYRVSEARFFFFFGSEVARVLGSDFQTRVSVSLGFYHSPPLMLLCADPAVPEERPRPEGDKDEDSPEGIETAQDSEDNDDDDDECTSESLMVVETQEGLTVLDTAENLSYYFVGENEAMESSLPGKVTHFSVLYISQS